MEVGEEEVGGGRKAGLTAEFSFGKGVDNRAGGARDAKLFGVPGPAQLHRRAGRAKVGAPLLAGMEDADDVIGIMAKRPDVVPAMIEASHGDDQDDRERGDIDQAFQKQVAAPGGGWAERTGFHGTVTSRTTTPMLRFSVEDHCRRRWLPGRVNWNFPGGRLAAALA